MPLLRLILCFVFPPLAVWDRGCGVTLLVALLTLLFWIPGVAAALLIVYQDLRLQGSPIFRRTGSLYSSAEAARSTPLFVDPEARQRRPPPLQRGSRSAAPPMPGNSPGRPTPGQERRTEADDGWTLLH
jgi:uncharacterized membrane protein YqaE (UPF0057 family)